MIKKTPTRVEIAQKYKWAMEDLYPNEGIWEEEYQTLLLLCEDIKEYKNTLSRSAAILAEFLKLYEKASILLERVYVYANQKYHEDTTHSQYQELSNRAEALMVSFEKATAFFTPEIISIPEEKLFAFLKEECLKLYERYLLELVRQKKHTLTAEMEELLAAAKEIAEAPNHIFAMFNNADIQFPVIQEDDGTAIQITHARYTNLLQSKNRRVRKEAFQKLYATYGNFKNTLATTFFAHVKKELFYAKARKYESSLAMALDDGNIPISVYTNLMQAVHQSLPHMHRYIALRKQVLQLDKLHMYDLYVPMVSDVEFKVKFEKAKEIVFAGLEPLGSEYQNILQEGYETGWIDIYENVGKRSGAYSWGAYGTHPYVLLNYQENLNNVFTLAHEMGHAIHSYYSDQTQPYLYAGYKIFVAEVASTCNEALVMHYLLQNTKDKKEKAYLLNYYLEQFRTTLFRQTMFAEFEMITHQKAQEGEVLTAENLCKIYHELNKTYFGDAIVIDEEIDMEWARIPHFYNSFYVYQYATGYSAAIALSGKILKEGRSAVEAYKKEFLCGGSSKDPIALLKNAGVDMRTTEPVERALQLFMELLQELEGLLL